MTRLSWHTSTASDTSPKGTASTYHHMVYLKGWAACTEASLNAPAHKHTDQGACKSKGTPWLWAYAMHCVSCTFCNPTAYAPTPSGWSPNRQHQPISIPCLDSIIVLYFFFTRTLGVRGMEPLSVCGP